MIHRLHVTVCRVHPNTASRLGNHAPRSTVHLQRGRVRKGHPSTQTPRHNPNHWNTDLQAYCSMCTCNPPRLTGIWFPDQRSRHTKVDRIHPGAADRGIGRCRSLHPRSIHRPNPVCKRVLLCWRHHPRCCSQARADHPGWNQCRMVAQGPHAFCNTKPVHHPDSTTHRCDRARIAVPGMVLHHQEGAGKTRRHGCPCIHSRRGDCIHQSQRRRTHPDGAWGDRSPFLHHTWLQECIAGNAGVHPGYAPRTFDPLSRTNPCFPLVCTCRTRHPRRCNPGSRIPGMFRSHLLPARYPSPDGSTCRNSHNWHQSTFPRHPGRFVCRTRRGRGCGIPTVHLGKALNQLRQNTVDRSPRTRTRLQEQNSQTRHPAPQQSSGSGTRTCDTQPPGSHQETNRPHPHLPGWCRAPQPGT